MFFDTASDLAFADGSTCGCVGLKKVQQHSSPKSNPQRVKCKNLGFFTQLNDHWNLIHGWKEGVKVDGFWKDGWDEDGWDEDGWMG